MLRTRVAAFIAEHGLIEPGARVVVGVSGGMDSVVLLQILQELGYEPVVAHVNYGLRGEASDADEALVRAAAEERAAPCHVHRVWLDGENVQAEARVVRYGFFGEVAEEVGAAVVATAHHRDDQAETLLLNLFRGSGPAGLAGIPVRRSLAPGSEISVVRPLLGVGREAIAAYARTRGLRWREDASNASGDYRRNVVRHDLLPRIAQHFGEGVGARIARTADLVRAYLDSGAALSAASLLDAASESLADGWALRIDVLAEQPETVRRGLLLEALRRWAPEAPRSAAAVGALDALLDAQPGRRIAWTGVTVWRERERLAFVPTTADESSEWTVEVGETDTETATPLGTLRVEPLDRVPDRFDTAPTVEVVDADRVRWPLTLRPWRDGDVFQPFGLDGHKKVSDVLTERRVPPHRRARQLVLLSEGEVVWVVGHRLGAQVAVDGRTQRVVRLVWIPTDALAPDGHRR